jgi:hypothetical protein
MPDTPRRTVLVVTLMVAAAFSTAITLSGEVAGRADRRTTTGAGRRSDLAMGFGLLGLAGRPPDESGELWVGGGCGAVVRRRPRP